MHGLDNHFLAHGESFLLGARLSIADFHGAAILSVGELVGERFDGFRHLQRQLARSAQGRTFESMAGAQAEAV